MRTAKWLGRSTIERAFADPSARPARARVTERAPRRAMRLTTLSSGVAVVDERQRSANQTASQTATLPMTPATMAREPSRDVVADISPATSPAAPIGISHTQFKAEDPTPPTALVTMSPPPTAMTAVVLTAVGGRNFDLSVTTMASDELDLGDREPARQRSTEGDRLKVARGEV